VVTAAFVALQATACSRPVTSWDTEQVYGAVIDTLYREPGTNLPMLVARTRTIPRVLFAPEGHLAREAKDLPPAFLSRFLEVNQVESTLAHFALVSAPQVFLDSLQEHEAFGEVPGKRGDPATERAHWAHFRARYPGAPGLIEFSRVGFDTGGHRALVCVVRVYGFLDASIDLVMLRRRSGHWVLEEMRNLAVS